MIQKFNNYLFIYGTLLPGGWLDQNDIKYKIIGDGTVNAIRINDTEYPACVPTSDTSKIVNGIVIEIDYKSFTLLDEYEEYYPTNKVDSLYIRELVNVTLENDVVKCWIYWFNS